MHANKSRILTVLITAVGSFFILAPSALATIEARYGLDYGSLTGLGTEDLRASVMGIVNILLGFLGILVLLLIFFGGFLMMTAGGDSSRNEQGRKAITAGIIGLVIIFSAYAISVFVITQLVTATGANQF